MVAAALGITGLVGGLAGAAGSRAQSNPIAPVMYQNAGAEQQIAAREEAAALQQQGLMAYEDSLYAAQQIQREYKSFKEQTALEAVSQGITMRGSPLAEAQRTEVLGAQEVAFTLKRGLAMSELYEAKGLQMLRQGSASQFQGFAQGLSSKFQGEAQAAASANQGFQMALGGIESGIKGIGAVGSWFRSRT